MELSKYIQAYEALLFDLDGTLVDTMPLHYRAYAEVFLERGVELRRSDFMALIGSPARLAIPSFLAAAGVREVHDGDVAVIHTHKKRVFERLLREVELTPLIAARLLEAARGRTKLALVSSGNRIGVTALLSAMHWTDAFEVVISGDDVSRGKPDPEPYLTAALALKVFPRNCLVIEDTEAGFASARAAGMSVLDVAELAGFQ